MNPEALIHSFKTPAHGYAFALAYMEGPVKLEILGVCMAHYRCLKLAAEWFVNMQAVLAGNAEALADATAMYREMIGR
jgi:hypothetical protein